MDAARNEPEPAGGHGRVHVMCHKPTKSTKAQKSHRVRLATEAIDYVRPPLTPSHGSCRWYVDWTNWITYSVVT